MVERTNETVEAACRHFVSPDLTDWDQWLPHIEFALNSAYHDALGCSPFELNRISVPLNPFQALLASKSLDVPQPKCPGVTSWLGVGKLGVGERTVLQAHLVFQHARRCVQSAKDRMKLRWDRHVAEHLYQPGDQVWLHTRHLSLRHPAMRGKLLPRYWGPIEVEALVGRNAVRLKLPTNLLSIHSTVSVTEVKPCRVRSTGELPPCNIDGSIEFELDQVINHHVVTSRRRGVPSVVEFQTRWKGSYDDDWLVPEDFEHAVETLCAYLNTLTPAMRKRVLRLFSKEALSFMPRYMRQQLSDS